MSFDRQREMNADDKAYREIERANEIRQRQQGKARRKQQIDARQEHRSKTRQAGRDDKFYGDGNVFSHFASPSKEKVPSVKADNKESSPAPVSLPPPSPRSSPR